MEVKEDHPLEELVHLDEEERGLLSLKQDDPQLDDLAPWSHLDNDSAERLLTEELEKMSLEEHETIAFDVHGIDRGDQEDPTDVESRLQEMEVELQKIRRKQAYERAKYCEEAWVQDRSFRLQFLRCDRFRSGLAAQRMVRHFQVKQELFGDGPILARDILLRDLSPEGMVALQSGFFQLLPIRDAAGRSIVSMVPMHLPDTCSIENIARSLWYTLMATLNDEETQHKGVVAIMSNFGKHARTERYSLVRQCERVRSAIPMKIVGIHYCYDNTFLKPFVQGIQLFLGKNMRTRFRAHFGGHDKIVFGLQTYGIPTRYYPILPNGDMSLEWHKDWLEVRQIHEKSKSVGDGIIITPRRFDVLFGRGKFSREHTGNLRALHLVEMHRSKYERASKLGKTAIADRIVQIIHESLGRFLKWEAQGWVEVDDLVAREKLSHFFRHLRSKTSTQDDAPTETSTKSEQSSANKRRIPDGSPPDEAAEPTKLAKEGIHGAGKNAVTE